MTIEHAGVCGSSGDTPWLRQLAETPLSERMALLNALIAAEFRAALLMDDGDVLPPEESYFALGLTSLGATEVRERLEVVIGRRIDSASLFDNPTICHLTAFLRSQVLPEFFAALFAVEDGSAIPENVGADAASNEQRAAKHLLNDLLKDLYQS